MQKGFWEEYQDMLEDYPDTEWGYLEGHCDDAYDFKFGPYNYLHGLCDAFAQALHEKYGYPLQYVISHESEDDPVELIHAYCVVERDGKAFYVDIRGVIDDYDEFIEEFGIELDGDYTYTCDSIEPLLEYSFAENSEYMVEARDIIELYPQYYKA